VSNAKAKLQIHVREACDADREAVFEFCRHTWSWGDYIPHVWDKWLREENGKVFVATVDGVPVGIQHITIDKPNEAWLSGSRTAPNYRRMGVATAITMKCLEYAKSMGVKVARLVTESDNKAAIAAVQKMGFKPVAEFLKWNWKTCQKLKAFPLLGQAQVSLKRFGVICSLQRFIAGLLAYTLFFIIGILWIGMI